MSIDVVETRQGKISPQEEKKDIFAEINARLRIGKRVSADMEDVLAFLDGLLLGVEWESKKK